MGSYDRDYSTPPRQRMVPGLTPVTKWLLISNLVIFFADMLLFRYRIVNFSAFAVRSAIFEGRIWEFITFQFMHASVGHVLFNSIGLYFFGPWMERWWGPGRFLIFYLLCGVAGAAFFSLLVFTHVLGDSYITELVGASAGIYGILIGVAVVAPNMRVQMLFPPIEMSLRTFAIAILAIAVGSIVLRLGGNEGGEAGHLGGAILGFLLVRYPFLLGKGDHDGILPPSWKRRQAQTESKLRPRTSVDLHTSNEIDRILDKINREGLQSLTEEERDTLRKASNS
ncbi:rhomboid family intramembrane serine protease [Luteolibacter ambystomatis]|uniref:Rhomboid family intramembrane serine protease n=1 Tax=Luteolibacter ambystomatis TaxID=2824561 RepID=A0A975G7A5_9BACT|nr:rhomboid family intramembrane serine protease [Luteolibacter ambystomatis]QUE50644.1 rhomboid family intramembrane serine protease [Luteolibacter ambystomatis]